MVRGVFFTFFSSIKLYTKKRVTYRLVFYFVLTENNKNGGLSFIVEMPF